MSVCLGEVERERPREGRNASLAYVGSSCWTRSLETRSGGASYTSDTTNVKVVTAGGGGACTSWLCSFGLADTSWIVAERDFAVAEAAGRRRHA